MGEVARERVRALREIASDLEADVKRWDGQDFTGRNVATMHGELAACVAAVAKITAAIESERSGVYVPPEEHTDG